MVKVNFGRKPIFEEVSGSTLLGKLACDILAIASQGRKKCLDLSPIQLHALTFMCS